MEQDIFDDPDDLDPVQPGPKQQVVDDAQAANTVQVNPDPGVDFEEAFQAMLPDVQGTELDEDNLNEVRKVLGYADDPKNNTCPKCGEALTADVDPMSLLSFPMKYVWSCAKCGFQETREDGHVDEQGSDPEMVDPSGELF